MAFQIWDDVRDLVCTEDELGKPAGHDMLEGTYTLPVIRALADPEAGPELSALLGRPLDGPELEKARDMILATGAIRSRLPKAGAGPIWRPRRSGDAAPSVGGGSNGARQAVAPVREASAGSLTGSSTTSWCPASVSR